MYWSNMTKDEWLTYFLDRTQTYLDYPFRQLKNNPPCVLRQQHNHKWVVLFGERHGQLYMNVKVKPDMVEELVMCQGVTYGYHMNKKHWVTINVNNTALTLEEITQLVLLSERLTKK